ncbi:MAG: hypothetical protein IJ433_03930 [Ruminococcus sp.]|nr:hypothetical protein [Ruminococcus sp.]
MKKFAIILMCALLILSLCACENKTENSTAETEAETLAYTGVNYNGNDIVGTWQCEDISKDCYFIFEENGDAFAKWGTSTVYGYFDYYEDESYYEIDVPNFLYNDYTATFDNDEMTLKSEDSSFTFKKATMPQVTIKAPDKLKVDKKVLGDWQSADTYECYRFNEDSTATITDMYTYATVECKYNCENGKLTFYYMSSDTKDGSREVDYSFDEYGKLVLDGVKFESVTV